MGVAEVVQSETGEVESGDQPVEGLGEEVGVDGFALTVANR